MRRLICRWFGHKALSVTYATLINGSGREDRFAYMFCCPRCHAHWTLDE